MVKSKKPKKQPASARPKSRGEPLKDFSAQLKDLYSWIYNGLAIEKAAALLGTTRETLFSHPETKKVILEAKARRSLDINSAITAMLLNTDDPKTSTLKIAFLNKEERDANTAENGAPTPKIEIVVSEKCASTLAKTSDSLNSTPNSTPPEKPEA